MRAFLLALAWGLLALSVAGLTFAVAASPHWGVGLLAGLLLVVVVAGLAFLARHQRAAIHDIKRDLARSRVVAEALIDASPDGIVLLEGTRIVSANPAARQLFGVSAAAGLAGRDLSTLIEPRDRQRLLAWVQHREAGGLEPDCLEFAGRRASGAPLPLEASAARIPLTQGAHLALFLRDLTDRQRVSQRSKIVDRLEGLGAAAVSLADEFEKVLGGMRDAAERARSGSASGETGEALELIERETLRGIALARRARAIVPETVEPGERQPVDVRSLLREIGGELTGRLGGAVRFEDRSPASDEPLLVSAAPGPLRQALTQVMENAAEAQREGTVLLRAHALAQDEVAASRRPGSEAGRFGVVAIKDQGEGMTDEVRTRAFAPFFSTKGTRASGLGLTLAAGIVRAHGGFIELDSEPGKGTVARLAFPLAAPAGGEAGEETGPVADERGVRGTETLLAVDDDGSALDSYRRLLQPLGYHVEAASAAEIALHRLRQRPEIDLVLLDMVLPGSTGPELVRRMLRARPGQRVLAVSPYPLPDKEEQVLELGAVGIFRKPLDSDKLPEAIRRALDRPRPAQPD